MTVKPESVGLSSERLRRIDRFVQARYIDTGRLPCAALTVARRGEAAHLGLMGWADEERRRPLREDTLFRIYSMTKPLTSVLFMMLVEEGKVGLDTPVHALIPAWRDLGVYAGGEPGSFRTRPCDRPMLMIDLLRHTSGLTYGFQERTPVDAAYRAAGIGELGRRVRPLAETIAVVAELPLEFSPGAAWNYSIATDVLGHLIGVIEGAPFEDVMRRRLLEPLGMADTGFQVPAREAGRLAACYALTADGERVLQDDPARSPYLEPPALVSGGGGLVSTLADYLAFCRMMLAEGAYRGERFLSPKTARLMAANHLPGGADLPAASISSYNEAGYAGVGFGLGFSVMMDPAKAMLPGTAGEIAWGGAASTAFWIDPAEDLIVIFMTQLIPPNLYPLRRELRAMVYAAITQSYAVRGA